MTPRIRSASAPSPTFLNVFGLDGDVGLTAGITLRGCASACSRLDSMSF